MIPVLLNVLSFMNIVFYFILVCFIYFYLFYFKIILFW